MDDETRARRERCTTFLTGWSSPPADLLATIPAGTTADAYGEGGVVAELEAHVSGILGAESAVFLPSGTMAQAATLRVLAGDGLCLWHPTCHLENHELDAWARVHGLRRRLVGPPSSWYGPGDLPPEPFAALLVELPMRELGGTLPSWDDLGALVAAVRERGARVHLDGARVWEAAAGYDRSPAEVVGLFDTAYVSFYKGVGALAGCCVVGPAPVVAQVREWRRRLGGTLYGLWPLAASALAQLPSALADMPRRLATARAIAAGLAGVPGVTVLPGVPQTSMFHLLLRVDADDYADRQRRLADEQGVWAWSALAPTADPAVGRVELPVHPRTPEPLDAVAAVAALVGA